MLAAAEREEGGSGCERWPSAAVTDVSEQQLQAQQQLRVAEQRLTCWRSSTRWSVQQDTRRTDEMIAEQWAVMATAAQAEVRRRTGALGGTEQASAEQLKLKENETA